MALAHGLCCTMHMVCVVLGTGFCQISEEIKGCNDTQTKKSCPRVGQNVVQGNLNTNGAHFSTQQVQWHILVTAAQPLAGGFSYKNSPRLTINLLPVVTVREKNWYWGSY